MPHTKGCLLSYIIIIIVIIYLLSPSYAEYQTHRILVQITRKRFNFIPFLMDIQRDLLPFTKIYNYSVKKNRYKDNFTMKSSLDSKEIILAYATII